MNLDWNTMFCDKHLRPLKKNWPKGAGQAMLGIFNAAVNDERIIARNGTKVENLPLIFHSIKPVCCFLPESVVKAVVKLALEGKVYGEQSNTTCTPTNEGEKND